jgi:DNA-binding CsgD family transcriptional regulator
MARAVLSQDTLEFETTYAATSRMPLFRMLAVRLVAERALQEAWGDGGTWLADAGRFFADRNHPRIASACRSTVRATGAKVPRDRRTDREVAPALRAVGVTAREAEVLELVRDRMQNREIGRRLYLSPRTVEKHVASLLAKTGSADREELILRREDGGAAPM